MKYAIKTEGMGCAHCIKRVREAMESLDAKIEKLELNDIVVELDKDEACVKSAIEELGFDVISINAQ